MQAIACLERAANRSFPDRDKLWHEIEQAIAKCAEGDAEHRRFRLDRCVYGLAIIYAHCTGKLPGYSNSDNETMFERFLAAVPLPRHVKATGSKIKAAIRRLDAKHNVGFLLDVKNYSLV